MQVSKAENSMNRERKRDSGSVEEKVAGRGQGNRE